jgi:hypothetical protein
MRIAPRSEGCTRKDRALSKSRRCSPSDGWVQGLTGFAHVRPFRPDTAARRSSTPVIAPETAGPEPTTTRKGRTVNHGAAFWFLLHAPERIRTSDLLLRRQALYPAELRARRGRRNKPSSVPRRAAARTISLGRPLPTASCSLPGTARIAPHGAGSPSSPIWPCSGWGLPCHACPQARGALLPHPFTLTCAVEDGHRRFAFCGTFRRLATPGRYPAPCPAELGLSSTRDQSPCRGPHSPPETTIFNVEF